MMLIDADGEDGADVIMAATAVAVTVRVTLLANFLNPKLYTALSNLYSKPPKPLNPKALRVILRTKSYSSSYWRDHGTS